LNSGFRLSEALELKAGMYEYRMALQVHPVIGKGDRNACAMPAPFGESSEPGWKTTGA